jgi:hypothetical protein
VLNGWLLRLLDGRWSGIVGLAGDRFGVGGVGSGLQQNGLALRRCGLADECRGRGALGERLARHRDRRGANGLCQGRWRGMRDPECAQGALRGILEPYKADQVDGLPVERGAALGLRQGAQLARPSHAFSLELREGRRTSKRVGKPGDQVRTAAPLRRSSVKSTARADIVRDPAANTLRSVSGHRTNGHQLTCRFSRARAPSAWVWMMLPVEFSRFC